MALNRLAKRERQRDAAGRPNTMERDALADMVTGERPEMREFQLIARKAAAAVQAGRLDDAEELHRSAMALADEEDWRTVTGAELPGAIRNHFAAHGDAARADEFLAGLQDKLGHATSAQDLREITRDDLRRAVLDYRDSAAGEPLPL